MARINAEHVNTFLMAASKVISETCNLTTKVGKPYIRNNTFTKDSIVIMIGVTGEMQGQVMLAFKKSVALMIASKMMYMEVKELDEISTSAICELGNMIMGNASTVFSSNGVGIDITPPTLSHGEVSFTNTYTKNLCVPLTFDTTTVELYLALKQD